MNSSPGPSAQPCRSLLPRATLHTVFRAQSRIRRSLLPRATLHTVLRAQSRTRRSLLPRATLYTVLCAQSRTRQVRPTVNHLRHITCASMNKRRPKTLHFWQGHLPHWQVENGRYFVTIHLYGAVPPIAHQRIHELSEQFRIAEAESDNVQSDLFIKLSRKIFLEMERWLDRSPVVSHFEHPELCNMLTEAIEHRQRVGVWEMLSFAIMPSHLHMFFEFNSDLSLKSELEEFKRWTGHQAAKVETNLSGNRFWQIEWFDHWSRNDEEDEKIISYIQNNPVKAGLASRIGLYPFCK